MIVYRVDWLTRNPLKRPAYQERALLEKKQTKNLKPKWTNFNQMNQFQTTVNQIVNQMELKLERKLEIEPATRMKWAFFSLYEISFKLKEKAHFRWILHRLNVKILYYCQ